MKELAPDYISPEFGLPLAALLTIVVVVLELRVRKKRIERSHDNR